MPDSQPGKAQALENLKAELAKCPVAEDDYRPSASDESQKTINELLSQLKERDMVIHQLRDELEQAKATVAKPKRGRKKKSVIA